MKERGIPKRDGSGQGMRKNKGRGGCRKVKQDRRGDGRGRRNRRTI